MNKIYFSILAVVALLLTGCSDSSGLESLLKTIPDNTSAVVTFNLGQLNQKMGNEQKGDGYQLSSELEKVLSMMPKKENARIRAILEGDAGVAMKSAAFYESRDEAFFTCYLDSPEKFAEYCEEELKIDLSKKENGYESDDNNIVVVGDRLWITTGEMKYSKAEELLDLSKDESFMSVEYASAMVESEADMQYFVNLDRVINMLKSSDAMKVRLALSTAYDDAKYVVGQMTFDNGKAVADMRILNSKFEPSKTSVELTTVNPGFVKGLKVDADFFMAMSVSKESITQMLEQFSGMGIPSEVSSIVKTLDGNMALAINTMEMTKSNSKSGFAVLLGFKSEADARNAISYMGVSGDPNLHVSFSGNNVLVNFGLESGDVPSSVISAMKGSSVAMVFDPSNIKKVASSFRPLKLFSITTPHDKDSFKLCATLEIGDDSENSLLSILKLIPKVEGDAMALQNAYAPSYSYDDYAFEDEYLYDSVAVVEEPDSDLDW